MKKLTVKSIQDQMDGKAVQMSLDELGKFILEVFFRYRDTTHYWHFLTETEATHSTLNDFYDRFLDDMDELIEQFTMAYGKIYNKELVLALPKMTDEQSPKMLMEELYNDVYKLSCVQQIKCRPDLHSQVRKILKLVSRTGYKLTLK